MLSSARILRVVAISWCGGGGGGEHKRTVNYLHPTLAKLVILSLNFSREYDMIFKLRR